MEKQIRILLGQLIRSTFPFYLDHSSHRKGKLFTLKIQRTVTQKYLLPDKVSHYRKLLSGNELNKYYAIPKCLGQSPPKEQRPIFEQRSRFVIRKPGAIRSHRLKTEINKSSAIEQESQQNRHEILKQIARQRDYSQLTDSQIRSQHEYLKFSLRKINNDVNRLLQSKMHRMPRKSTTFFSINSMTPNFEKEIIANQKQINDLNYQLRKLEIRRKQIEEPEARMGLDTQLESLRSSIKQTLKTNQELKRKNIIRQREIIGVYNKINTGAEERSLEVELIDQLKKKKLMEDKLQQVESENYKIMEEADIDERVDELLKKVKELNKAVEQKGKINHLGMLYQSKLVSLENMSKRRDQYQDSFKTQYYRKLKNLQTKCGQLEQLEKNCLIVESRLIETQQQIDKLSKMLRNPIKNERGSQNLSFQDSQSGGFMITQLSRSVNAQKRTPITSSQVKTQVMVKQLQNKQEQPINEEIYSNGSTVKQPNKRQLAKDNDSELNSYLEQDFDSP